MIIYIFTTMSRKLTKEEIEEIIDFVEPNPHIPRRFSNGYSRKLKKQTTQTIKRSNCLSRNNSPIKKRT